MRTTLFALTFASAAVLGLATPAFADVGSGYSIQRAIAAAEYYGVVGFNEIQYDDGTWEIDGRDPRGRSVTVRVDAMTGAVVKIEH